MDLTPSTEWFPLKLGQLTEKVVQGIEDEKRLRKKGNRTEKGYESIIKKNVYDQEKGNLMN